MTKDRLVEVLGKINGGEDAGFYHDEIETAIAVIIDHVSQADVDKAYAELQEDKAEE